MLRLLYDTVQNRVLITCIFLWASKIEKSYKNLGKKVDF